PNNSKYNFITPFKKKQTWRFNSIVNIIYEPNIEKVKRSNLPLIVSCPYSCLKVKTRNQGRYTVLSYFKKHNKTAYISEGGALPGFIYLDKNGFLSNSSSYFEKNWNHPLDKDKMNKVDKYMEEFMNDSTTRKKQKSSRVNGDIFLEFKGKIKVFVPMQVWNDTTMILFCGWVRTLENFQKIIKDLAKKNNDIIFLVKNHPRCSKFKMGNSKNIRIVDNYHYKDCIKNCDVVLTINSGVGLQSMMWEKPTVIVGKSFYQFENVNYQANNKEEIMQLIHNAKKPDMKKSKDLYTIWYSNFIA
ncbi:unnamed protein product, partial [marine sediment metagenome]